MQSNFILNYELFHSLNHLVSCMLTPYAKLKKFWEYFEIFWKMEILLQFYGNQISLSSGYFHETLPKHQSIYYQILNWCTHVTNLFYVFIIISLNIWVSFEGKFYQNLI